MTFQRVRRHLSKKWRQRRQSGQPQTKLHQQHHVVVKGVSVNAKKVMQRLVKAGFSGFLVGGGVRDLLVGQKPKDFDVVTDASPEQIRKLFQRSRIIGRRFRLVHVYFRGEIIEVCTFRANANESGKPSATVPHLDGLPQMPARDNTYGTIEEDAWRRDFTVNALYYSSANNTVVDYVNGMADIKQRVIRMIGDPSQRFHEDPVRLLRAIRLAAKLNFEIDVEMQQSLQDLGELLYHVPPARILDEMLKLFFKGYAIVTYRKLNEYGYLDVLFPQTAAAMSQSVSPSSAQLFELALQATDYRFHNSMTLNPGFLFSVFLWPALQYQLQQQAGQHRFFFKQLREAITIVFAEQQQVFLLSKRLKKMIRSIWVLQYYLEKPRQRRVQRVLQHRYFRAAADFIQLRAESGEPLAAQADWWQQLRGKDSATCKKIIAAMQE